MSTLNQWPQQERPREKLLKRGSQSLSDAELLAIFLRCGIAGKNVIELAQELLGHFDGLQNLFSANLKEFTSVKGLGPAKYVQLQACLEMSQRYLAEQISQGDLLQNPAQVKSYLQTRLKARLNEVFAVLFLDNQHRVIEYQELFFGTINASSVHPRIILQRCLQLNAAAVILCHNHPSGIAEASISDKDITDTIKAALALIDVRLLDHLIVAAHQVISMAEQGQI